MKINKLLLLTSFLLPLSLIAQWTLQDPGFDEPMEITYVHAVNENVVWIAAHKPGASGMEAPVFARTLDGGNSWIPDSLEGMAGINSSMIFAFDENTAWIPMFVVVDGWTQQGIYKTSDGGETWNRQPGAFDFWLSFPNNVYFFDADNGVATGDNQGGYFELYTTTNGGGSWERVPEANIPSPLPDEAGIVGHFDAVGAVFWFSTNRGRVYRSADRGYTWSVSQTDFGSQIEIAFNSQAHGIVLDRTTWQSEAVSETNDGGLTWSLVEHTGHPLIWDIHYIPGTPSTFISDNNGVSFSLNGGHDWHYLPGTEGVQYFKSDWYNNTTGWVGGINNATNRATINKYNGPGITGLTFSASEINFGDVQLGSTSVTSLSLNNLSETEINVLDLYTDNSDFWLSSNSGTIAAGESMVVDVFFTPSSMGEATATLYIEPDFPDLTSVTIALSGNGVSAAADLIVDPDQLEATLFTGEVQTGNLTITNIGDVDINYQLDIPDFTSLDMLGWNYASTPLGSGSGILGQEPDQAMFVKDFNISEFSVATIYLGFDDGARIWINGTLAFDFLHDDHSIEYWNVEEDVSAYLVQGRNRISVVVFNGIYSGCCEGAFDCQLTVDEVDVIVSGDMYPGAPEAMWHYFGQTGERLVPPKDANDFNWWDSGYGIYDWLQISNLAGQELSCLGWNLASTPFIDRNDLLFNAPDNAQFIKDFIVGAYSTAILNLGFDDGCMVWLNGIMVFDFHDEVHGVNYWDQELNISDFLQSGRNRIAVEVYNGIYGGGGGGGFDCELIIDDVPVIKRGDQNYGEPEALWYYYGQAGQILTPPQAGNGNIWSDKNYGTGATSVGENLQNMGWNFDTTPFFQRFDILAFPPDNAQFIKDINIGDYSSATLNLGYDDGCRVWINGILAFDFHEDVNGLIYWNRENLDVTGMLLPGRNRIAVEVYNGVWGGAGWGSFDCQLTVDGIDLIKPGNVYSGEPEAMWYFYGQAGQMLTPPVDQNGNVWNAFNYGESVPVFQTSYSGIIAAGETESFQVRLDASGLPGGNYEDVLRIYNENSDTEISVPVTLNVISDAQLSVSPATLDFGDYYYDFPETMLLTVSNKGFEVLEITNVYSDSPDVYADPVNFTLNPGERTSVVITLDTYYEGVFFSSLYFENTSMNNPLTKVLISANCRWNPSLVIQNVDYLYAHLAPDEQETQNLHIENWGGSVLDFTIPQAVNKSVPSQGIRHNISTDKSQMPDQRFIELNTKPSRRENDVIRHQKLLKGVPSPTSGKVGFLGTIDLFFDDMEHGTNGWTIENYEQTQSQWHQVIFNSNSPETSWWCGNETTGTYDNGSVVNEALVSPTIKLPPMECSITLEFFENYDVEDGYDQCYVDISNDNGENWMRIREGNPGNSEGWVYTTLDISEFWDQEVRIRFFFAGDESVNDFPGWFVDDMKILVNDFPFLSFSPSDGVVYSGEGFDIDVNFDASGMNDGFYPAFLVLFTNDPENNQFFLPVNLEVTSQASTQTIDIPVGWSGISTYVIPENNFVEDLFAPVVDKLVILQSDDAFWWPSQWINNIGYWHYNQGYKIKMNEAVQLEVNGLIPGNLKINMPSGWSMLPVLSNQPVSTSVFDPAGTLVIVKDVAGTGVYWPEYGINTIENLIPGKSYYILVNDAESIIYPDMWGKTAGNFKASPANFTSPWNEITPTGTSHVVVIKSGEMEQFSPGYILGVFTTEGLCAGFAGISNASQNITLTVFADDPTTAIKEGFSVGESMQFRLFKPSTAETILLEATFDLSLPNQGNFTAEGLSAISRLKETSVYISEPANEGINIFPNPTAGILQILTSVPVERLEVIDVAGIKVLTIERKLQPCDKIDISDLPGGIYQIRMVTSYKTVVQKIIKY